MLLMLLHLLSIGAPIEALASAQTRLASGDAHGALELLRSSTPPLDDYRALLLAEAYAREGDRERALALLEPLPEIQKTCASSSRDLRSVPVELRLKKAEILAEQSPSLAARVLAEIPSRAWMLPRGIELYRKAGEVREAETLEARLLVDLPDTLEGRTLAASLGPSAVSARLSTVARRLARLRRLLETHQNEAALAESQVLLGELGSKRKETCELLYVAGKASRKLRQYDPATRTLKAARARCTSLGELEFSLRAGLLELQVRAIRGDLSGVRDVAAWIGKGHADHRFHDDALVTLAELLERKERGDEAAVVYKRVLAEHRQGDQAHVAAWRLAFRAIKRGDLESAGATLESLLASPPPGAPSIDLARARYWLARTLEERDQDRARALYEETARELSFYGWLALARLKKIRPEWESALEAELMKLRSQRHRSLPEAKSIQGSVAKGIQGTREHERARAFHDLGLPDYAFSELAALECRAETKEQIFALAAAYDAVGAHAEAQRLVRAHATLELSSPLRPETLEIRYAAYSRPYLEEIRSAASASNVEPYLLFGLVREESTFDPRVVSWAGATGLAQLMPATAVGAFAALGLGKLDVERLIDPALNAKLGARVLSDGLVRFGGIEALALAAYNGGAGLAARLRPRSGSTPFELWVEDIAVKETRNYVRRVLESWAIYRFLYDDEHPFIALPEVIGGA